MAYFLQFIKNIFIKENTGILHKDGVKKGRMWYQV